MPQRTLQRFDEWGTAVHHPIAQGRVGPPRAAALIVFLFMLTPLAAVPASASSPSAPDSTPPSLGCATPLDGATVHLSTLQIACSAERGALVTANGVALASSEEGEFSGTVGLEPGDNTVWVEATDAAGNIARLRLAITYADPVPDLQARLDDALREVARARSWIASAGGELGGLDGAFAQTGDAAGSASLATSRLELEAADHALDRAWAYVNAFGALLDQARLDLARSEGAATAAAAKLDQVEAVAAALEKVAEGLRRELAASHAAANATLLQLDASRREGAALELRAQDAEDRLSRAQADLRGQTLRADALTCALIALAGVVFAMGVRPRRLHPREK